MSLMTQAAPRVACDPAAMHGNTLAATHLAMIKRFAKSAATAAGFAVVIVVIMSIKYVAFFPRFMH